MYEDFMVREDMESRNEIDHARSDFHRRSFHSRGERMETLDGLSELAQKEAFIT